MRRVQWKWYSLVIASLGLTTLQAQDGVWKPVTEHRARYESVDGSGQHLMLIGRPITGKSKVDQAVEPASFGADQSNMAPLPTAPSGRPTEYEALGYPRTSPSTGGTIPMANAVAPGARTVPVPMGAVPNGTMTYPNGVVNYPFSDSIMPVPQQGGSPVVINGQVVNGQIVNGPIMGSPVYDTGMISNGCPDGNCFGGMSDRYYMQASHGSPGIWYGSLEYTLFSLGKDNSPPLVITGPQTTTSINSPGVAVLYGGPLSNESLMGGKATIGVWFNRCQTWGMFGSYFTTATHQESFLASSPDGSTFLARPFFNNSPVNFDGSPHTPGEDIERVSQTGLGGSVDVNRSLVLRGADLNFRFNWCNYTSCSGKFAWNIDSYFGVKYLGLDESLSVTENLTVLTTVPGQVTAGDKFFVRDSFMTRNNFVGGNIGLMSEMRLGRFFFDTHGGIGIGANSQEVTIAGNTQITQGGVASPLLTGGLLAQQTNIGTYNRAQFSVTPEIGFKLGFQVTDHFRVFAGYDVTYWTNVVRPGQQIDYTVNTSQLPRLDGNGNPVNPTLVGPARPAFNWQSSNLWLSGFSAGVSWVF